MCTRFVTSSAWRSSWRPQMLCMRQNDGAYSSDSSRTLMRVLRRVYETGVAHTTRRRRARRGCWNSCWEALCSHTTSRSPCFKHFQSHTDLSAPSKSLVNAAFKMAFWLGNRESHSIEGTRESVAWAVAGLSGGGWAPTPHPHPTPPPTRHSGQGGASVQAQYKHVRCGEWRGWAPLVGLRPAAPHFSHTGSAHNYLVQTRGPQV